MRWLMSGWDKRGGVVLLLLDLFEFAWKRETVLVFKVRMVLFVC